VKDAAKEVLTSPETIDKGASVIADFANKQGFKVTKDQVAQILTNAEQAAAAGAKTVTQEVQTAMPGSKAVQLPASLKA
jgi:hypothetical protein